jgi:hypothetical protein
MPETQPTTQLITRERPLFDEARLAVASFLARYSGATRVSYTADLRYWFAWCHECRLDVFAAAATWSCGRACRRTPASHQPPSARACQRWRASTASPP